jgi:hypothetical protein
VPSEEKLDKYLFKQLKGEVRKDDDGKRYTHFTYRGPELRGVRDGYKDEYGKFAEWLQQKSSEVRKSIESALVYYTSSNYWAVNKALREGQFQSLKSQGEVDRAIRGLYGAMVPTKTDLVVWRGLPNNDRAKGLKAGDQVSLSGMVSTTQSVTIGRRFAKMDHFQDDYTGVLWEIDVPKGSSAIIPGNISETEWILPHGTTMEILSVTKRAAVAFVEDISDVVIKNGVTEIVPGVRETTHRYGYVIKARVIETPSKPPAIKGWEPEPYVVTQKKGKPTP